MKKQIKKLSLSRRTISNLSSSEMNRQIGGAQTQKGNTCADHTACNTATGFCTYGCTQSICGNFSKHGGCGCTTF